jgi:hypothetical protein
MSAPTFETIASGAGRSPAATIAMTDDGPPRGKDEPPRLALPREPVAETLQSDFVPEQRPVEIAD